MDAPVKRGMPSSANAKPKEIPSPHAADPEDEWEEF